MSEHFIVAVEHGRLRIYAERNATAPFPPRLQLVESVDLGEVDAAPLARTRHGTLRFAAARVGAVPAVPETPAANSGSGRRETHRRQARLIAARLQAFWQEHPMASWDLAASPGFYSAVIDALSPEVTRRLKRVYSNQLLAHGGQAGAAAAMA